MNVITEWCCDYCFFCNHRFARPLYHLILHFRALSNWLIADLNEIYNEAKAERSSGQDCEASQIFSIFRCSCTPSERATSNLFRRAKNLSIVNVYRNLIRTEPRRSWTKPTSFFRSAIDQANTGNVGTRRCAWWNRRRPPLDALYSHLGNRRKWRVIVTWMLANRPALANVVSASAAKPWFANSLR